MILLSYRLIYGGDNMRSWLVAIREQKGMSQKSVAEKVEISQPSYCNIENGERSPSVATAKRIAVVLDFDWTRFFEDEERGSTGPHSSQNDGDHGRESA